jgi:hypothetical protein
METRERLRGDVSKIPIRCVKTAPRTANSACSPALFAQISGFGDNPVKYTDPDGRFETNPHLYNQYCGNVISGTIYGVFAGIGSFFGGIGNFLHNFFSGNAKPELSMGVTFTTLPGIKATAKYSSDGKSASLDFSTSVDSTSSIAENLLGMTGSPVKISSNGVTVGYGVAEVTIKENTASVKIKMESGLSEGINVHAGLSIEASTQDGPFGTIQNGQGMVGEGAKKANYLLGSQSVKDMLLE